MEFYEGDPTLPAADAPLQASHFLNFYDEDFVEQVYRRLLNRKPDTKGRAYYLDRVRSGASRYEILYSITSSEEFTRGNTAVAGLKAYRVYRVITKVPFLGTIVNAVIFLSRINAFMQDMRALENHLFRLSSRRGQGTKS